MIFLHALQQKQAEQEEEFIVNKLMKRLDQLKREKQVLANEVGEAITADCQPYTLHCILALHTCTAYLHCILALHTCTAPAAHSVAVKLERFMGSAGRARGGISGQQSAT